MEIHMEYYLVISTVMLFAGIYGFITRRNLLAILISIELILNSVDINFAVFNPLPFSRSIGRFFLHLVCNRNISLRNGRGHRHHYKHIPEHQEYPGKELE